MDKYIRVMPFGLVLLLSGKCIVLGAAYSDVALLAVLSALGSYLHFSTKDKRFEELENKQAELEKAVQARSKEVDEIKTHLSGIKLANAIRPVQNKF
jgi:hypothetical protein